MKLPDVPINGTVYALGFSGRQVAESIGKKFSSPDLYEEYDEAYQALAWGDDGMRIFRLDVSVIEE